MTEPNNTISNDRTIEVGINLEILVGTLLRNSPLIQKDFFLHQKTHKIHSQLKELNRTIKNKTNTQ